MVSLFKKQCECWLFVQKHMDRTVSAYFAVYCSFCKRNLVKIKAVTPRIMVHGEGFSLSAFSQDIHYYDWSQNSSMSLGLMFQVGSLPELISIRYKKDKAGAGVAHSTVFLYFSQSAFNSSSQCFNCVQFSSPILEKKSCAGHMDSD